MSQIHLRDLLYDIEEKRKRSAINRGRRIVERFDQDGERAVPYDRAGVEAIRRAVTKANRPDPRRR